jgi:cytidylate kinase
MKVIPSTIAIDGPAASGKSTIAVRVADELGYLYFDTGVMYRAVTWLAIQQGVQIEDEQEISRLAEDVVIDVFPPSVNDGRRSDIKANGEDLTWVIRKPEVDANVSVVSAYSGVREALTVQQRRIGQRGKVVMVGRDIGTVVLPDADLKIYLDASLDERARRRYIESIDRGESVTLDNVLSALKKRDQIDSTREIAPLCAAEDAIVVDTDHMDIEQVLDVAWKLIYGWSQPDP